jgi:LysM repeat protein
MNRVVAGWVARGLVFISFLTACSRQFINPTPSLVPTLDNRSATVNEIVQRVEARASESGAFEQVPRGYVLRAGGQVKTGSQSQARLDLSDGTTIRLAENSSFSLQEIKPASGGLLTHLQLETGKIWVNLMGGGMVEVKTPVGVAWVRGSFAIIQFSLGDPNNTDDDLLVIDCLEGACTAQTAEGVIHLGNLERLALSNLGQLRMVLTGADVLAFILENPESQGLIATLTAAPPAASPADASTPALDQTLAATIGTPGPATWLASPTLIFIASPTQPAQLPGRTSAPIATSAAPPATLLGQHVVQRGENLFCIGRGYGVLPNAIAQVNGLSAPFALSPGQILRIPAVRWDRLISGPVCTPQFSSPFAALPTAPILTTATVIASAAPTCAPPEFFDPLLKRCRLPDTAVPQVTSTSTAVLPPEDSPTPTLVLPPAETATPTATPSIAPNPDTTGPSINKLNARPTTVDSFSTCTFTAELAIESGLSSFSLMLDCDSQRSGPSLSAVKSPIFLSYAIYPSYRHSV